MKNLNVSNMKRIMAGLACLLIMSAANSQNCYTGPNTLIPGTGTTPGFSPATTSLAPLTSGGYVADTLYFTNYTTLSGLAMDSLVFDSIGDLPAGLCWTSNKANNSYAGGENGVFLISGTTNATPGQYRLNIYVHAALTGITIPPYADFSALTGIYYYIRVACGNGTTPAVDTVNGRSQPFIAYTSGCTLSPFASISASGATTFCQGGSVTLTATGTAGNSYYWSNGATTQAITVSTTGNYTATVYGATDTAVSNTISVVASACASPGFSPPSSQQACITYGQTVDDTIFFTNYTSLSMIPIDSIRFDSINNLPAGLTWSTDKPGNNFLAGDSGWIRIYGTATGAPGQYKLDMIVNVGLSGLPTVYNYNISGVSGGSDYYLRMACTNGSCLPVDSMLGASAAFIPYTSSCTEGPVATISANGATTFCTGGQVTLYAPTAAGYTYLWSTGSSSSYLTVGATGSYGLTVYAGGDSAVAAPVAVVADSCTNPVYGSPGLYPSSQFTPCIIDGDYVHDTLVFVNYSVVSGLTLDSLTFDSIGNLPAGLIWSTSKANNTFYAGDTGMIFISGYTSAPAGQYSLQFLIGAGLNAVVLPPYTEASTVFGLYYWLRIACGNGSCTDVDTVNGKTSAFISNSACSTLSASINALGATSICPGGSVTLVATGSSPIVSYSWSDGENTDTIVISPAVSGLYTVTVTSDSGAIATASIYITVNPGTSAYFTVQPDTTPHVWYIVNQCGANAVSYIWSWGDGSYGSGVAPSHTYDSAGYYDICVTASDAGGCSAVYCDTNVYLFKNQSGQVVQIYVLQYPEGINTINNSSENISYYAGSVHFSENIISPADVTLYDLSGRQVMTQRGFTGSELPINSAFAKGVYIIRLQNNTYSISKKLTILQ